MEFLSPKQKDYIRQNYTIEQYYRYGNFRRVWAMRFGGVVIIIIDIYYLLTGYKNIWFLTLSLIFGLLYTIFAVWFYKKYKQEVEEIFKD